LYLWNGEHLAPIATPNTMTVTSAAFRSPREGMAIGTTKSNPGNQSGGSFIIGWVILALLVLFLGGLVWGIIHTIRRKQWKILSALVLGIVAIVVLILYFVNFGNSPKQFTFNPGTHYVGETGQPSSLVAITTDAGDHWRTLTLGTNFYLTGCAPVDSAYLIITYASMDHLDGDLWKVPVDSLHPAGLFSPGRALWGIAESDSMVFVYGTDISVAHVGNPWQSVRGEVFRTNLRLDTVNVLELSSNGGIISLSAEDSANFWAVTRNHLLKKNSNAIVSAVSFVAESLPMKIATISPNDIAVLDSVGHIFVSRDDGTSWQSLSLPDSTQASAIIGMAGTLYAADDRGKVFRIALE
ncbi:MAG: hypothetical protein ACHQNE_02765, partial [Candidatus Kapaibacterium sp.]